MAPHPARFIVRLFVCAVGLASTAATPTSRPAPPPPTREQVIAQMMPFDGPSAPGGVDRSTLDGKVVTGYQGWFSGDGDGSGATFRHYGRGGKLEPGRVSIDIWPDVGELDADERYATGFRHADGTVAQVFSSFNRKTVVRHFEWMRTAGIDAAFVQRFGGEVRGTGGLRHFNAVLESCRAGANQHGRAYSVMYDLSGLRAGETSVVIADWKLLVDRMKLGRDANDKAYQRHNGKPVVSVWGVGFNDGRQYTLAECDALIDFLKNDPQYGGNTVMVGVPMGWRTLSHDAIKDAELHRTLQKADIISPWNVGRYGSPKSVAKDAGPRWRADVAWCGEHGKAYLPVVFPGFSWNNLKPGSPLDQIPRLKGQFLWRQCVEAKAAGVNMLYVAMFDEMDEATAIFKTTDSPPVGESKFLTMEGLPSDHYLWLTGQAGRMLRGEIPATEEMPKR